MLFEIYTNKNKLITDILRECRTFKQSISIGDKPQQDMGRKANYIITIKKQKAIERWHINLYITDKVCTQMTLYLPQIDKYIYYPFTTWDSPYRRWDSELKTFLEREILKMQ